ncbi:hypothetical protein EG68_11281 [Paragonimus skrjabini miyazakii]|uniref:Uncharacterized protein n=1 Tax=Paragonimus skrjabini miyazakii TaxID=59628 RepID=A0A8S9YEV9_9TREM|nr:hypothetical protein EG68_11281 [Paragonimus skrjabini miyazakii]
MRTNMTEVFRILRQHKISDYGCTCSNTNIFPQ